MSSDREHHLGNWLIGGSSGLSALVAVTLLWAYSPAPTGAYWETEGYPAHLGGSGPSPGIQSKRKRTDPGELIRADLKAIRQFARLELADIEAAGFEWADSAHPDDWKKSHGKHERHQDFLRYQRAERPRYDAHRKVLVLRPVGTWPRQRRYLAPIIARFLMAYYQRPVRWEDKVPLPRKYRISGDGAQHHMQYPVMPTLDRLQKAVPDDAIAVIGITAQDLYPKPSWSFVFGMADLRNRVGVISLARMFPYFWGNFRTKLARRLALLRTLKVLAHETDHALGINHCRAFQCALNGCTGLKEHDRTPAHLCPLCLAKLAWRLNLDVGRRYHELGQFYMRQGLREEARWYQEQAERIATPPALKGAAAWAR